MRLGRFFMLVLLASAAVAVFGCSRSQRPRAVFLIVVDTLRPDRLSVYGYDRHETASIDALAERGVMFTNAQATASWTIPSMGTMMTSLYPAQLGLIESAAGEGERFGSRQTRDQLTYTLSQEEYTLAEIMSEAGFRTAGFVNQPALNNRDGFVQGFGDWFYPVGADSVARRDGGEPLMEARAREDKTGREHATTWGHTSRADAALVNALDGWLADNGGEPLFVWLHLLSPHKPYEPEPHYAPPGDKPRPTELYDGEVRYIDDLIGAVMASIEQHVGVDRSLIVFTSDHGEEFGEHREYEHGHSLHREVVTIPLILAGPGLPAGQTVNTRVRLTDILPTIVEIATGPESTPDGIEGTSLVPFVGGDRDDLMIFQEGVLYGPTERSITVNRHKLMWDQQAERYRLYDTAQDPREKADLIHSSRQLAEPMGKALSTFREKLQADYERRFGGEAPLVSKEETERVRKAMNALGYVNE